MKGFNRQFSTRRPGRGFAFKELLVVLIVIGMLVAFVVPMLRAAKQRSLGLQCADHLRQIGQGVLQYMSENRGALPRTRASLDADAQPTWGTGAASPEPFGESGPAINDVTAGPFLLIRQELVAPGAFVCPLTTVTVDDFGRDSRGAMGRSNFSDVKANLGYSFANVYAQRSGEGRANYRMRGSGDLAYAADRNPGLRNADNDGADDVRRPVEEAPASIMRLGNSNNHAKTGQNILYCDGRVAWFEHPLAGCLDDNIFTRAARPYGAASDLKDPLGNPRDAMDSVLLPTDD
jgi:type II secretory pathway pseudopilin PulG